MDRICRSRGTRTKLEKNPHFLVNSFYFREDDIIICFLAWKWTKHGIWAFWLKNFRLKLVVKSILLESPGTHFMHMRIKRGCFKNSSTNILAKFYSKLTRKHQDNISFYFQSNHGRICIICIKGYRILAIIEEIWNVGPVT